MFSGISITCFTASYAVTFGLELSRRFFRSGLRGALMLGFAAAGFLAHTGFIYYRATHAAGAPLSSPRDWYLLASWLLAATYLYLACCHPRTTVGVFLLPMVLLPIGVAALAASDRPFDGGPAARAWGAIHGGCLLVAAAAMLVGFATGSMYLHQEYRLKHKLPPPRGAKLPSLEWLGHANGRATIVGMLALAAGVVAGMELNLVDPANQVSWRDPMVCGTLVMFGWLTFSTLAILFYKPLRRGRRVAYLTLLSFLLLAIALGMGLLARGRHVGSVGRTLVRPGSAQGSCTAVGNALRGVPLGTAERRRSSLPELPPARGDRT
jgi:ABC-type uncharacterized transport system permease subunit